MPLGDLFCMQICLENSKLINMNIQADTKIEVLLSEGGLQGKLDTEIVYNYRNGQSQRFRVTNRFACWRNNQVSIIDFLVSFIR